MNGCSVHDQKLKNIKSCTFCDPAHERVNKSENVLFFYKITLFYIPVHERVVKS